MKTRLATADDLAGIFAIYDEHVLRGTATFETVVKTPEEKRAWLVAHGAETHPVIVAVDDAGTVAGWAALSPWSPRQAYARIAESSVYIHPSHHRTGLGRRLMKELIEMARARTAVRVFIARIALPAPGSIGLHESLGYRPIGTMRRCGEKFGRVLDVLLMDLHLDE